MTKVKVIDLDVAKLDPNAVHLVIFNKALLSRASMVDIVKRLEDLGIEAVYAESHDPEKTIKVYQIPKGDS